MSSINLQSSIERVLNAYSQVSDYSLDDRRESFCNRFPNLTVEEFGEFLIYLYTETDNLYENFTKTTIKNTLNLDSFIIDNTKYTREVITNHYDKLMDPQDVLDNLDEDCDEFKQLIILLKEKITVDLIEEKKYTDICEEVSREAISNEMVIVKKFKKEPFIGKLYTEYKNSKIILDYEGNVIGMLNKTEDKIVQLEKQEIEFVVNSGLNYRPV